jgi:hypothetical protein
MYFIPGIPDIISARKALNVQCDIRFSEESLCETFLSKLKKHSDLDLQVGECAEIFSVPRSEIFIDNNVFF